VKIRNPFLINLGGWIGAWIVRLLFFTLRVQTHNNNPKCDPRSPECDQKYLFSFWHEWVLMPIGFCNFPCAGLVSRHQDGGVLAAAMRFLKIKLVRGSSSRGGARALRELLDVAEDYQIAITPDGPRGPRRKLKEGIIYLSSQTGNPIICSAFALHNAWVVRGSWTDLEVPKPFSRVEIFVAPPITVPPHADRKTIEEYLQKAQTIMDDLDAQVDKALGRTSPINSTQVERRNAA